MHVLDVLLFEIRKHFLDPNSQQLSTFLLGIGHNEAVYMHQWHLLSFHLFCVIGKHIKELYGVDWEIHVDVVRLSELLLVGVFFFVDFAHSLSCTHVPAFDAIFYLVKLAVVDQILVAVRIKVVRYNEKSLSCCSNSQWPNSAEDISQKLSTLHVAEHPISFLLQPRAPVNLFEIELKLYSLLF